MILHIRNIKTKREAIAIPAFVTHSPRGMMVGNSAVVERDGKEIMIMVKDYEMYYNGDYINLYVASKEGFLDSDILRSERKYYEINS